MDLLGEAKNKKKLVDIAQEEIEKIIFSKLRLGEKEVIIKAKEIHEKLNFGNRYPVICSAMRKVQAKYKNEVIKSPPKGDGVNLEIKYILKK